jgi:hypothetical protein
MNPNPFLCDTDRMFITHTQHFTIFIYYEITQVFLSRKLFYKIRFRTSQITTKPISVTSEVLTAVKMSLLVFWEVTPCGLVGRYLRFSTEDGGNMFFRNVGTYLRLHTALQPRRLTSAVTHEFRCSEF